MTQGFSANQRVVFIASTDELRTGLSRRRIPLAEPAIRVLRNPFTGQPVNVPTCDPDPDGDFVPPRLVDRLAVISAVDFETEIAEWTYRSFSPPWKAARHLERSCGIPAEGLGARRASTRQTGVPCRPAATHDPCLAEELRHFANPGPRRGQASLDVKRYASLAPVPEA